MPEKPLFAHDYTKDNVELVRRTCLYVSTKLGDQLDDLVVVGGLVPSLLIPDESLPAGEDVHIGTMDLDLGLSLAILDRERYEDLTQRLHRSGFEPDEKAERKIWVCGPGAFIVLKALAFHQRGESKDAYDLYFVIRNYGSGIDEVFECLSPLLKETETKKALEILTRDFVDPDSLGPSRVAQFQYNEPNPDLQADVAGYIRELLDKCSKPGS